MQLLRYLRLFLRYHRIRLRAQLEYETDFLIGILGVFLTQFANFTFVWVVFTQVPKLVGWTLWEAAFLYALLVIPRGLVDFFCDGAWQLPYQVNSGNFDLLLIRPAPLALQVFGLGSRIHGLGHVLLGGGLLVVATSRLGLVWTPFKLGMLLLALVNSLVILGSIVLATNSTAFWERSGSNALAILFSQLSDAVQVPITAYGRGLRFVLSWIVPFAFVTYYPTCLLLDRPLDPPWMAWGLFLSGPITAGVTALWWSTSVRRYESSG